MSEWVLGIDGGGSKTEAWLAPRLAPEGAGKSTPEHLLPVGRGLAGSSNLTTLGAAGSLSAIANAADQAFRVAGMSACRVEAACLAVAGSARLDLRRELEGRALGELARAVFVVHDAAPVLACVDDDGAGIAVISGTGSIVFGRNRRGQVARAGGFGALYSDPGSGFDLSRRAIVAVLSAHDGTGPETSLSGLFLERFSAADVAGLIEALHRTGFDPAAIATHADLVDLAAQRGDAVAMQILRTAAARLADGVVAVARKLSLRLTDTALGLAGGVLIRSPMLAPTLEQELSSRGLAPRTRTIVRQPVAGAVLLARGLLEPGFDPGSWWWT